MAEKISVSVEGSDLEIDFIKMIAEAKARYYSSPKNSEEEKVAFACWNELLLAQIESSTTTEEAGAVHEATPKNPPIEAAALSKWNNLSIYKAESADTAKKAAMAYFGAPNNSEAKLLAMNNWDELSLEDVTRATTLVEIDEVIRSTRSGSKSEEAAIKKRDLLLSINENEVDSSRDTRGGFVCYEG